MFLLRRSAVFVNHWSPKMTRFRRSHAFIATINTILVITGIKAAFVNEVSFVFTAILKKSLSCYEENPEIPIKFHPVTGNFSFSERLFIRT